MLGLDLGLALTLTPSPEPTAGFRCKRALISEGDRTHRVRRLCGAPTHAEQRIEQRYIPDCGGAACWTTVTVDSWVYDFGPRRFVQYLMFENGVLVRIENGDWGHD